MENQNIERFLYEIIEVYKKYGFSIAHQDEHGSFEVEKYKEENIEWLLGANDGTGD